VAARFWVGGTGTWSAINLLNWSATSGGTGGATVPSTGDSVTFDANSGTGTVTLNYNPVVQTLNISAYTGTLAFGTQNITLNLTAANQFNGGTGCTITGTPVVNISTTTGSIGIVATAMTEANSISFNITGTNTSASLAVSGSVKNLSFGTATGALASAGRTIYGNLTLSSTMSLTAGTNVTTFGATSGTQTITSNAKTMDFPITINGVGGTVQLVDALTMGSSRTLTLTNGTFNSNAKSVTCGAFSGNNSNTKTFTITNSTFTVLSGTSTSGFLLNPTGTTYNVTGSNVVFTTSGAAQYWGGGGSTFPQITMSGTGQLIIGASGSTFTITTLSNTVQPCTVSIISTNTQLNVTNFNLSGTAGNLVTFNSSVAGTSKTISKTSGTVNALYLNVQDSTASGGAKWYANSSNDLGNNTGWNIFNNSFLQVF
jgi:hypothetical protein